VQDRLDVAEQLIDVLARDAQAASLIFVQRAAGVRRNIEFCLAHLAAIIERAQLNGCATPRALHGSAPGEQLGADRCRGHASATGSLSGVIICPA
jgi:hypothetical protein